MPFNAVYFGAYGELKRRLTPEDGPLPPERMLLAGMLAGSAAAGLTTPGDVVKTRMQAGVGSYGGVGDCVRRLYAVGGEGLKIALSPDFGPLSPMKRASAPQEGGAGAFFKGLGPRLMIIPPLFGITLTCFEMLQRRLFPDTVRNPSERELNPYTLAALRGLPHLASRCSRGGSSPTRWLEVAFSLHFSAISFDEPDSLAAGGAPRRGANAPGAAAGGCGAPPDRSAGEQAHCHPGDSHLVPRRSP